VVTGTRAPVPSDLKCPEANERYACAHGISYTIHNDTRTAVLRVSPPHSPTPYIHRTYIGAPAWAPACWSEARRRTGILAAWDGPNFRAFAQEGVGVHAQRLL
jgi:hypothetical protein